MAVVGHRIGVHHAGKHDIATVALQTDVGVQCDLAVENQRQAVAIASATGVDIAVEENIAEDVAACSAVVVSRLQRQRPVAADARRGVIAIPVDTVVGLDRHVGAAGQSRIDRVETDRDCCSVGAARQPSITRSHRDAVRVEQPQAALAFLSRSVGGLAHRQLGAAGLDLAAVAALGAAGGFQCAVHARQAARFLDIGPGDHGTALAVVGRRCIEHGTGGDGGLAGLFDRRVLALPATAHINLAAALGAGGVELSAAVDRHTIAGHDDLAALGGVGRNIDTPSDLHTALVAHQRDQAVFTDIQGTGFDQSGVVDDGARQGFRGTGGQQDFPGIGTNGTAVFDQRLERTFFHFQLHRAAQVERHDTACAQQHIALVRGDVAFVDDFCSDQGNGAALCGIDVALVDHRCGAVATETVIAGEEIFCGHVERGGHQAADINLCAGREQDAVGVDQEHVAVGFQCALDHRHIRAQHAVQGDGRRAGLDELDGVAFADGKALPVNGELVAALMNGHVVAILMNAAVTRHDIAARRQPSRRGDRGEDATAHADDEPEVEGLTAFVFALAFDQLGCHLPRAHHGIPDDSVSSIHFCSLILNAAGRAMTTRRFAVDKIKWKTAPGRITARNTKLLRSIMSAT